MSGALKWRGLGPSEYVSDGGTYLVSLVDRNWHLYKRVPLDGDHLYAAGFLFGLSHNLSLHKCAELGSLLGGNVIEVIGPKMDETRWVNIKSKVAEIMSE